MSVFDFTSDRLVLAGTAYGEARGCGPSGMQDVLQTVLNRTADGWPGGTLAGICLAPYQFSCWNVTDPNRTEIQAAASAYTPLWQQALALADEAIAGNGPNRILGADSYFARTMKTTPYWARSPAVWRYTDSCHNFWRVHPAVSAPVVSVHSSLTADDLNALELSGGSVI